MIVRRVAAEPKPYTVADLVDRLGGVPLSRIRMKPALGTATEADLEKAGKPVCELIDGVLVEKAVGYFESVLGSEIARLIGNHVSVNDLGSVSGEAGYIRLGEGNVRAPDVTFIAWEAFPEEALPKVAYPSVAPTLIVEVLSPGNTKAEIDRKLREFFAAGCKLAWVIDPATKTAKVHTSATKAKSLDESGVLDGGKVLPGFKLPLAELFAVGTRKRKKK